MPGSTPQHELTGTWGFRSERAVVCRGAEGVERVVVGGHTAAHRSLEVGTHYVTAGGGRRTKTSWLRQITHSGTAAEPSAGPEA